RVVDHRHQVRDQRRRVENRQIAAQAVPPPASVLVDEVLRKDLLLEVVEESRRRAVRIIQYLLRRDRLNEVAGVADHRHVTLIPQVADAGQARMESEISGAGDGDWQEARLW